MPMPEGADFRAGRTRPLLGELIHGRRCLIGLCDQIECRQADGGGDYHIGKASLHLESPYAQAPVSMQPGPGGAEEDDQDHRFIATLALAVRRKNDLAQTLPEPVSGVSDDRAVGEKHHVIRSRVHGEHFGGLGRAAQSDARLSPPV